MGRRSVRAAEKAEARRRADRELLDAALAPYVLEPLTVTVRVANGATIDIRRSPSRAGVVRLRRRPLASLTG